ncbi:class E basic helix-loop-helix protein 22-like [Rousettus aegyptiacus]|uniref:class E basic helix-loop-helix protein 22-like n=1 Tax=Rousettus aegyptiacus TaxID=9407 RepID=UPI00168D6EFD|nr:class E basic helix-loop-helix protein 22-like [Rousettus aegyptiacus]
MILGILKPWPGRGKGRCPGSPGKDGAETGPDCLRPEALPRWAAAQCLPFGLPSPGLALRGPSRGNSGRLAPGVAAVTRPRPRPRTALRLSPGCSAPTRPPWPGPGTKSGAARCPNPDLRAAAERPLVCGKSRGGTGGGGGGGSRQEPEEVAVKSQTRRPRGGSWRLRGARSLGQGWVPARPSPCPALPAETERRFPIVLRPAA